MGEALTLGQRKQPIMTIMKTVRNAEGAKAGEGEKKQIMRNAWACIVVGAETEAIFVGVEGGIDSCGYSSIQRDGEM